MRTATMFVACMLFLLSQRVVADPLPTTRSALNKGMYNAIEMGATGDGVTDDTAAIQRALDAAAADGGGVVTLPTGTYRINTHLTMPPNTALEGVWRAPVRGEPPTAGSVLLAIEGKGSEDGPPFIAMGTSTTLRGISIFYPDQIKANPPHPFPWTVQTLPNTDNATIVDVTMINPYKAVDFGTNTTGRHYINGLYAHALYRGLYVNLCFDVGRIENIHFWPFWDIDPKSPLWEFTKQHGTAFTFGKVDGELGFNLFSIFYNTSMHFIAGPMGTRDDGTPRTGAGSGVFTNCYLDITTTAVKIDEVMPTAGVSFVNGMFMSGIEIGPNNRGPVTFSACGFWANKEQSFHAQTAGSGPVTFDACHFSNWDRVNQGFPCLDLNNRNTIVTSCTFETTRPDHLKVRLGPLVQSAVITSNFMQSGVLIDNRTSSRADVQIGFNTGTIQDGFASRWLVLGPFTKPASETGKLAHDFLESLGGEASAVLTSSSATRVICKDGAFLDLRDQFGPDATTAYAFCLIESPTAQRAQLCYGANDYARLWLNHKQVHESTTSEQGDSDRGRHTVDVELNAGLNPLLVRIDDAGGKQWGLILEVFGQDGKPLKTTLE